MSRSSPRQFSYTARSAAKDIRQAGGRIMKSTYSPSDETDKNFNFQDAAPETIQLAVNYASDYLDYMDNLPNSMQRSVTRLREVDQKCREYVNEIEQLFESFTKESSAGSKTNRTHLLQIRRLLGLCKKLGDEKIAIVQGISEVIESRNKRLEYGYKRFKYAYEPSGKTEHGGIKEKYDSVKTTKRSRRQRNNTSSESKERVYHNFNKIEDPNEPPPKVLVSSLFEDHTSIPVPALTRAALREEDKRTANRLKEKEENRCNNEKDHSCNTTLAKSCQMTQSLAAISRDNSPSLHTSINRNKSSTNASSLAKSSSKKKKKRKSNKHSTDRFGNNNDQISMLDLPIDPDEPTYCLCQQVSFGQMIGCDNLKCPIEWFHFSCVRLTHKPKGKWYCPDCLVKRKRDSKKGEYR